MRSTPPTATAWVAAALILAGAPSSAEPGGSAASTTAIAQTPGVPFMASWDYRDYGGHSQSWAIAQDLRGVMYFGNGNGVLQYDGGGWRLIPVANGSIVRSLAVDAAGTVYVGAVGELGLLRTDGDGNLAYVSLLGELDAGDGELRDVWRTWASDDGIFYWAGKKLFRWQGGRFRVWAIDANRAPSMIRGKLYNNQPGLGLTVLGDDQAFHPVAGGAALDGKGVMFMLPGGEGGILAGTHGGELLLLSPAQGEQSGGSTAELKRFETAADDLLARHQLYTGIRLPDGDYAFGTISGGSVVIGAGGELRHHFTRVEGLPDESVWSLYADREGGLWHALNRGLARFELGTPITTLAETAGLGGTVEALCRAAGSLHIATSLGLYRLAAGGVENIGGGAPYWSLLAFPDGDEASGLLAGARLGVYQLRGGQLTEVVSAVNAFVLSLSVHRPGTVWVGDMSGVGVLERRGDAWVDAGRLAGVDKEVRSLVEDDDGRLWLGTHFDGALRVTLEPGPEARVATVESFGLDQGIGSNQNLRVLAHDGAVLAASVAGLVRFEPSAGRFVPSTLLGTGLDADSILRWRPDAHGNLWLSLLQGTQVIAVRGADGTFELDRQHLSRLDDRSIHAILPEPDAVWLGGVEGLFRVDLAGLGLAAARTRRETRSPVLIRRVGIARPGGRVLFGGSPAESWRSPTLAYAESSLRFEYALPRFDGRENNLYRSRLLGLEEGWSDWSGENYRDYVALREGHYRFEVQGRDTDRSSSEVAAFDFRVLPPWYRTGWAYASYALALAALAWALLGWLVRRARLEMEVRRLTEANAVMERTEQERRQFVRELEAKHDEMERFIYTVSHDLKSPLISIRGFLGMLERDMSAGEQSRMRHDMDRIHAATGKMGRLVEELLELSRVGRQASEPAAVDMGELAREAADQVAGLIAERHAEVVISPRLPPATGDRQRLRAMLQNLIENGVKYMGQQPSPRIEIDHRQSGSETVYQVRDNGAGIDPRYREKIFGLFERLATDTEGTGVGLALVKRIVEFHGGRVWVESEGEGKGSTFCFTLARSPADSAQGLSAIES